MLRMSGAIPLLPHMSSWCEQGEKGAALRHSIKIFWYLNLNPASKQELFMTLTVAD
jgi:hypothetical protein